MGMPPMSRLNLTCLQQRGIALTDIQAAKERNDTASIRKLLDTCRPAPGGIEGNITHRQPKNFRTGTAPVERNGTKVFPARNLSEHRVMNGMIPASFAGNVTHKFTGANATLFHKGSQQNGTIIPPNVNGSVLSRMGAHLKGNSTAPHSLSRPYRGIV